MFGPINDQLGRAVSTWIDSLNRGIAHGPIGLVIESVRVGTRLDERSAWLQLQVHGSIAHGPDGHSP